MLCGVKVGVGVGVVWCGVLNWLCGCVCVHVVLKWLCVCAHVVLKWLCVCDVCSGVFGCVMWLCVCTWCCVWVRVHMWCYVWCGGVCAENMKDETNIHTHTHKQTRSCHTHRTDNTQITQSHTKKKPHRTQHKKKMSTIFCNEKKGSC